MPKPEWLGTYRSSIEGISILILQFYCLISAQEYARPLEIHFVPP